MTSVATPGNVVVEPLDKPPERAGPKDAVQCCETLSRHLDRLQPPPNRPPRDLSHPPIPETTQPLPAPLRSRAAANPHAPRAGEPSRLVHPVRNAVVRMELAPHIVPGERGLATRLLLRRRQCDPDEVGVGLGESRSDSTLRSGRRRARLRSRPRETPPYSAHHGVQDFGSVHRVAETEPSSSAGIACEVADRPRSVSVARTVVSGGIRPG